MFNLGHQAPMTSMLLGRRLTMLQPVTQFRFATQTQNEDAEEAEIVVGSGGNILQDRSGDKEFQNWLKKDLSTSKQKQIDWKRKKRSVFAKIGFNENHIPHQGNYPKDKKKERLAQWDNPKFNWPPKIPRPTMHKGKTLLNHLDSEERKRIENEREFNMPNMRTGDVIELSMFSSLSEAKLTTNKGVVFGRSHVNNLRNTIWFNTVIDSVNVQHKVKLNSPMVAKIDILKYGSNKNRKKLSHIPSLDLTATRILDPVIRGKNYKPRHQCWSGKKRPNAVRRAFMGIEKDKKSQSVKKLEQSDLDAQAGKRKSMNLDTPESFE